MTTEAKYAGLTGEELERALYTDPDATELERELATELADAEESHQGEIDWFKGEIARLDTEIARLEAEVERLNHELERAA